MHFSLPLDCLPLLRRRCHRRCRRRRRPRHRFLPPPPPLPPLLSVPLPLLLLLPPPPPPKLELERVAGALGGVVDAALAEAVKEAKW